MKKQDAIISFFALCFGLLYAVTVSAAPEAAPIPERIIWDKRPIRVTLPVGTERLIHFPAEVKLGVPARINARQLRRQSYQGTTYWLAYEPFETTRVQVQETRGKGRVYLLDIQAVKKKTSAAPIEILAQASSIQSKTPGKPVVANTSLDYVTLTRYAAQQLYAPSRLIPADATIHRSPVLQQTLTHLVRGKRIDARPLAAWKKGGLTITAIQLTNRERHAVELDPRALRGQFRTAAFQHARLAPHGVEHDTTALYVISDRPLPEVLYGQ